MSWVLFRWLTVIYLAAMAGLFAVPVLFCAGVPEVIVFYVLRAVGIALFASAGVLGTVTAAGHLLGIRFRCPLCGSWAEWILRMLGEPVDVGPILWCSRCGEVHGGGVSAVGDRDPPAERLPLGHRAAIPSGADGEVRGVDGVVRLAGDPQSGLIASRYDEVGRVESHDVVRLRRTRPAAAVAAAAMRRMLPGSGTGTKL